MKYKKTVLTFFASAVVLCGAFSGFAQQLPEIIWNKEAQRPEAPGFSTTYSIKFSPNGQRVFAGGSKFIGNELGSITIFNAADGADLNATPNFFPIKAINELSVSLDGQRLATAHNGVACTNIFQTDCRFAYILYDAQQLTRLSEPQTSFNPAQSVDYSPDNQLVAVGDYSNANNIKLLNPTDLSLLGTLPGHTLVFGGGRTMSVRFSPDGQILASGGGDDKVKLWRVSDGSLLRTFDFNSIREEVFSVAFSPNGQYIAATDRSRASMVKIWRVADGSLVRVFTNPEFNSTVSNKVTWTRDGRYVVSSVVSGNDPSRIRFWNFATGGLAREYIGATLNDAIRTLEFAPDGRTFAFSYGSRVILARNPFAPTGKEVSDIDDAGRTDQ